MKMEDVQAMSTTQGSFDALYDPEVFIGDSGASSHSTFSNEGALREIPCETTSIGHTGEAIRAESSLTLRGRFMDRNGYSSTPAILDDVKYNRKYNFNLLSLTRLAEQGWIIKGDVNGFTASKDGQTIKFDIKVQTATGVIFACRFVRSRDINATSTGKGTTLNIKKAHEILGHHSEENTRKIAKRLDWTLTRGTLRNKPCQACAESKAKQKNVRKEGTTPKSTKPGERIYLDVTKVSVRKENGGEYNLKHKWWCIMVDEATGKKYAHYTRTKNGIVEPTCEWVHRMNSRGIKIKRIRVDPGGENIKLESRAQSVDWQALQPLDFEYTSRDTPQHNHLAEVAFPYLAGLARAMISTANVPDKDRGQVVIPAIQLAVQLDGLRVVEVNGKVATRNEHMYGQNPAWVKHMKTFGECGVVKEGKRGKAGNRGIAMMFVGYADKRESDSFVMYNPKTGETVTTRDVIWLKRMMFEPDKKSIDDDSDTEEEEEESDVEEEELLPTKVRRSRIKRVKFAEQVETDADSIEENSQESIDENSQESTEENSPVTAEDTATSDTGARGRDSQIPPASQSRSGRSIKPRSRLIEQMQARADVGEITAADLHYMQSMIEILGIEGPDVMGVGAASSNYNNTAELHVLNYRQAMESENREEWKKEVKREKERFDKNNALTPRKRSEIPEGVTVMTSTWAMKKKSNGTFRARCNLRGFQQRDGEHYESSSISSPVTNATAVRIALTMLALCVGWIAIIVDVEGAFLQGEYTDGEEIYMEVPQGWEEYYDEDTVLKLNVPIYGTKQGAACFYRKLVKVLKAKNYQRSKADPCLFYRWNDGRLVIMLSWIDDNLIMGHPEDVKQFKKDIEEGFKCKYEGLLKEYVGSKIDINRGDDGTEIKITQPVLVQSLEDEFDLPGGKAPKTPATAGQVLIHEPGEVNLDTRASTKYRSGTAKLMFLMQWSRPDIYNTVRGLARHMSTPQAKHVKAMHNCMKYVLATRNRGLRLKPEGKWNGRKGFKYRIHGRSDSDYAANTQDRRSISGGRTFLNGAPVVFRSSTQRFVTLSVTEAETAAGVIVAQDMMYVYRILTSVGLEVELPMILEMDNKGAVDLANNYSSGGRTRHVDVRNFYLRELKDEGILRIQHVSGEENDADIFTKNTTYAIFNKHVRQFVGEDEYIDDDATQTTERGGVSEGDFSLSSLSAEIPLRDTERDQIEHALSASSSACKTGIRKSSETSS